MAVGSHPLPTEILDTCTGLVYCFATWASDVTLGMFWVLALGSFSVVIFLATSRFGSTRAFGFSGFVGMIGGVWLSVLQLIPWWVGSTFIIVGVISIMGMIISDK